MKDFELDVVRGRLEQFLAETLFPACTLTQQRRWGDVYVRGLLLDGERKSVGAMAGRMPDGNEQAMQQFVSQSKWLFDPVRQRLAQQMEPLLADDGAWVIDDTGFPKKGEHSVAVARQYSGTLGKVGNCQVAVSLHLAASNAGLPLDFQLYLPKEWADDPERCRKAGIPADVEHQEKWRIALGLIDRIRNWKLVDRPVVADAGYGRVTEFRDELAGRGLKYVVSVDEDMGCWLGDVPATRRTHKRSGRPLKTFNYAERPTSALDVAKGLPVSDWKDITWTQGSKGALRSRFAAARIHVSHGFHHGEAPRDEEWLIIEWPVGEEKPTDYWISNLPATTALAELVRLGKIRWQIEQGYQQLKEELGLDHFEGRSWIGWNRHVTLTMVAFAFLVRERLRGQKRGAKMGPP